MVIHLTGEHDDRVVMTVGDRRSGHGPVLTWRAIQKAGLGPAIWPACGFGEARYFL
jgi:hypothetical protein